MTLSLNETKSRHEVDIEHRIPVLMFKVNLHKCYFHVQNGRRAAEKKTLHVPVDEMQISLIRPSPQADRHLCLCERQRAWCGLAFISMGLLLERTPLWEMRRGEAHHNLCNTRRKGEMINYAHTQNASEKTQQNTSYMYFLVMSVRICLHLPLLLMGGICKLAEGTYDCTDV